MMAARSPVTRAIGCVQTREITEHVILRAESLAQDPIAYIHSAACLSLGNEKQYNGLKKLGAICRLSGCSSSQPPLS